MKKSLFIAIALAFVFCAYGYFASTAGHDHREHAHEAEDGHADHAH